MNENEINTTIELPSPNPKQEQMLKSTANELLLFGSRARR